MTVPLRIFLAFVLLYAGVSVPSVDATSLVSAGRIGGSAGESVTSIARDPSGAVYLTGLFGGSADFDPGPGTTTLSPVGNVDALVVKLDSSGALVWASRIGGSLADRGTSVVADASGVYVAGSFEGTIDLDPGPGTTTAVSQGGADVFLVKLDPAGAFIWGRSFGGTVDDRGTALALSGGELYLVGDFRGTVDVDPGPATVTVTSQNGSTDIFLSKFDLSGSLVWAKTLRSGQEELSQGLTADASGIYLTGIFNGTTDFDPGAGNTSLTSSQNSLDVFILKLDAAGAFVWVKSIGAASTDVSTGIAVDASGVYVTGYFDGTVDFDPGAGTMTVTATGATIDAFLLKLDLAGNFAWVRRFGNTATDVPFDVAANSSGVYVTGYFGGTVDFDPNAATFSLSASGPVDVFVARLTATGDFTTAYRLGGSGSDFGAALALNGSTVYLAGIFENSADFDPGLGTATLTSAGFGDIFLSVVNAAPDPPVATVDAYAVATNSTLTIAASGVLTNDTNPSGSAASLQAVLVTPPTKGTLNLQPDGSFTYVPNTGVTGSDQFTYRATNGGASSSPTTVTLTINATACAPRPSERVTTTASGGKLHVTVTASALGTGATNTIQELRFSAGRTNAIVNINGSTIPATGEVIVPINATSAAFDVSRSTAGVATTVPFIVVDGCGPWQTLVGGGPAAF